MVNIMGLMLKVKGFMLNVFFAKNLYIFWSIGKLVVDMAGANDVKKILGEIEKKLDECMKKIDVKALEDAIRTYERVTKEIEKLEAERDKAIKTIAENLERVDVNIFKTLKSLGMNGVADLVMKAEEILMNVSGGKERKTSTKGIGRRKIKFCGKVYNVAQYFLRKHGITGGLDGLKEWARKNGYNIEITDDMIIIE